MLKRILLCSLFNLIRQEYVHQYSAFYLSNCSYCIQSVLVVLGMDSVFACVYLSLSATLLVCILISLVPSKSFRYTITRNVFNSPVVVFFFHFIAVLRW